jgi:hypothetical protein
MFHRPVVVRRGPGLLGKPAPARRATSAEDRVAELQELVELEASGFLTEEEYQREKQRILGG